MNGNTKTTDPTELRRDIRLLEETLRRQLEAHKQLLACVERNREAVRQADMQQIRSVCEEQNTVAQGLAELEKVRLTLVGRLTERLEPDAQQPVSLGRIAAELDEPAGGRFQALAAQLKQTVEEVRKASAVVRTAADALARHMSGRMQTVQSVLARAPGAGARGPTQARQRGVGLLARTAKNGCTRNIQATRAQYPFSVTMLPPNPSARSDA